MLGLSRCLIIVGGGMGEDFPRRSMGEEERTGESEVESGVAPGNVVTR